MTLNYDHEEHIGMHSLINAAALEEPLSPSIATMMTVAVLAPEPAAEYNTIRPRPPSGNSTPTTTGSSIRYSVAAATTPPTYALKTVTYLQATALHGGSGAVVTRDS